MMEETEANSNNVLEHFHRSILRHQLETGSLPSWVTPNFPPNTSHLSSTPCDASQLSSEPQNAYQLSSAPNLESNNVLEHFHQKVRQHQLETGSLPSWMTPSFPPNTSHHLSSTPCDASQLSSKPHHASQLSSATNLDDASHLSSTPRNASQLSSEPHSASQLSSAQNLDDASHLSSTLCNASHLSSAPNLKFNIGQQVLTPKGSSLDVGPSHQTPSNKLNVGHSPLAPDVSGDDAVHSLAFPNPKLDAAHIPPGFNLDVTRPPLMPTVGLDYIPSSLPDPCLHLDTTYQPPQGPRGRLNNGHPSPASGFRLYSAHPPQPRSNVKTEVSTPSVTSSSNFPTAHPLPFEHFLHTIGSPRTVSRGRDDDGDAHSPTIPHDDVDEYPPPRKQIRRYDLRKILTGSYAMNSDITLAFTIAIIFVSF